MVGFGGGVVMTVMGVGGSYCAFFPSSCVQCLSNLKQLYMVSAIYTPI